VGSDATEHQAKRGDQAGEPETIKASEADSISDMG